MQYSFHHSSFYLCSILFITPASTYAVFFSSLQLLFIQFSFEKFYATPLSPKCLLVVKLYLPCPVITKLGLITTVVVLRPRSVSVSVLAIRDLRTSCPRTDPSTSGATPKLVTGGWSGFFAKSIFT